MCRIKYKNLFRHVKYHTKSQFKMIVNKGTLKKIEQEIKIWMKVLTDFQTDSRNTLIPWHALTKYLT